MRKTEHMLHRRVARRLKALDVSQKELAILFGVSMESISAWTAIERVMFNESGVYVPTNVT